MLYTQPQGGQLTVDPTFVPFLPQRVVNFAVDETDIMTNTMLTRVGGGTFASAVGKQGLGLTFGDAGGVTYLSAAVRAEARNNFTMVWVGQVSAAGIFIRDFSVTGGTIIGWNNAGVFDLRVGGTDYTGVGTFANNVDHVLVVTSAPTGVRLFVNGTLVISGGAPGAGALISPWTIHRNGNNAMGVAATTRLWTMFAKAFPDALAKEVSANPWRLFFDEDEEADTVLPYNAGGGTQTFSYTTTGGMTLGGVSELIRSVSPSGAGGIIFGGAASVTFSAGTQSQTVTPTGGIVFSGLSAAARGVIKTTTGGILFGGNATVVLSPDPTPVTVRAFKRCRRPRTRKF